MRRATALTHAGYKELSNFKNANWK